jgi:hypothetical protein
MKKITITIRSKDATGQKVSLKPDMCVPLVDGAQPTETEMFETLDEALSRAKDIGGEVAIIDNS